MSWINDASLAIPLAATTFTVLALTLAAQRHATRLSPSIPYAGEGSLRSRLQVPVEYGKDPIKFLVETRKKLGDVFCVDLLVTKIVFMLGAEGNKEVLKASEEQLSFWAQIRWSMGPLMNWALDFQDWLAVSQKLVRAGILRLDREANFESVCERITEGFFEQWAEEEKVPLFESISALILNYLFVFLTGEEFFKRHANELVPLMQRFEREVQNPILRVTPWSLWKYTKPGKFLFTVASRFDSLVAEELRDIISNPEQHAGRGDYLYYIVSQVGDRYGPVYGNHIMGLIFAGHANAAMTIPWMFLHARRVPGALERMRDEVELERGERRPYLEACLRETGRLYTNTSILRMSTENINVNGHTIPKGTLVGCSPVASQRADPAECVDGIYAEAERWIPERFLEDPNAYSGWFQRVEFVQFGLGVHACPGERVARIMMYDLVLKTWLTKYDVKVLSGLEEGTKGVDGVGAEAAWTEENFGTPSIRGEDILVQVKRK